MTGSGIDPLSTVVCVRDASGTVSRHDTDDLNQGTFAGSVPFRAPKSHKGQPNFPGWYWSATTAGFVPYESLLELSHLLLIDFDPWIRWIYGQPFRLECGSRRHVPDFLLIEGDGSMTVVEVKPKDRQDFRNNRQIIVWGRDVSAICGWHYEVRTEPDRRLTENVRFLAGFRRPGPYSSEFLDELCEIAGGGLPFTVLCNRFAASAHLDVASAKPYIFHALWTNQLKADLTKTLGPLGEIWAQRRK
jgi:hypothetical protein